MVNEYEHQCPKCGTTFMLKVRPKWNEVHLCVECQRQAARERIPENLRKCKVCQQRKEIKRFRGRRIVCNDCVLSGYELLIECELQTVKTDNGLKQCKVCKEWKAIKTSFLRNHSSPDGHQHTCKKCLRIVRARHLQEGKVALNQRNREKAKANEKRRRKAKEQRRVAREKGLPSDFTKDDWNHALDYFKGCCAVCGRQMNDMFGEFKPAADHWIPLSFEGVDNLGSVPKNIVPLCHGVGGCNNSKNNKLPTDWLKEKFGQRKAAEILKRIEAFFQTVRKTQ